MKLVNVIKLGRMSYGGALKIQETVVRRHLDLMKQPGFEDPHRLDTLLLVEHDPPVYTVGLRTQEYPPEVESQLRALGADFYRTARGGLITWHGPGQLVAYPVLNLKRFRPSVAWYVQAIENVAIRTCARYGLVGRGRSKEKASLTGVWIGERKVAAIGVQCRRYVTSHGLSLNVHCDLSWYSHVRPCGLPPDSVTSLSRELQRDVTLNDAETHLLDSFKEVFECDLVHASVSSLSTDGHRPVRT